MGYLLFGVNVVSLHNILRVSERQIIWLAEKMIHHLTHHHTIRHSYWIPLSVVLMDAQNVNQNEGVHFVSPHCLLPHNTFIALVFVNGWLNQPLSELFWVNIYQNPLCLRNEDSWSRWNQATDVMLVWTDGAKMQKGQVVWCLCCYCSTLIGLFFFKTEDRIPDNNPPAWKWDQELRGPNY